MFRKGGYAEVSVPPYDDFRITNSPQTVTVYKQEEPVIYALTVKGGMAKPAKAPAGAGAYSLVVEKACHLKYTVWKPANYLKTPGAGGVDNSTDLNGDGKINDEDLNIVWNPSGYLKAISNCTYSY